MSTNLHRRHLNASQRARIADKLANLKEGRPSETAQKSAVSQSAAAKLLNVSRGAVQQAAKVSSTGTPGLGAAVDSGRLPVSTASEAASMPAPVQDKLVEAVTNAAIPKWKLLFHLEDRPRRKKDIPYRRRGRAG